MHDLETYFLGGKVVGDNLFTFHVCRNWHIADKVFQPWEHGLVRIISHFSQSKPIMKIDSEFFLYF